MMPASDAMTDSKTEQAALDYLDRGWSAIPIHEKAKRPAVPWKVYQKRHAKKKTVHEWFRRSPNYNVGIVTGELSGLVVVDVDPRHDGDKRLHRCAAVDASVQTSNERLARYDVIVSPPATTAVVGRWAGWQYRPSPRVCRVP